MADSPFIQAARWLDPNKNTKFHKRHAELVERWRAYQNDLADLYEKPEDQRGGWGFDGGEAESELLEVLQNIEAELLQLRARLRLDKIMLPPKRSMPPLLQKRLNLAGDSMIFSFEVPKASRKARFRPAPEEDGGGVTFPVTFSWSEDPIDSLPGSITFTDANSAQFAGETFGAGNFFYVPPEISYGAPIITWSSNGGNPVFEWVNGGWQGAAGGGVFMGLTIS